VDANVQAAFDTLRGHVNRGFGRVDQQFERVDRRFEQIDQRLEQVDRRFEQVDQRFEQVDQRLDRLETAVGDVWRHVDATALETRREFHVVEEGIRSDIRLLAEGFSLRFERLETTLRNEMVRSHDDLASLIRAAYTDLDRRVTLLERRPRDPA
jgi:septal ring factor EnvC (AmiA/AmiB activator)